MRIDFKFSYQLQNAIAPDDAIPSDAAIGKKIEALAGFWNSYGPSIEQSLNKHAGLSFTKDSLSCYLNTKTSFSDPLAICIESLEDMKDTLIHELIHQLFMQNENNKDFDKKWNAYWENPLFSKESRLTKSHIYLHAIHLLVTEDLFPEREKAIIIYTKKPDYVKAWEIVLKFGPKKIRDLFNNGKQD